MQLVIDTSNTVLSVKNKCFYIENESVHHQISPKRVSSIAVTTNCQLNAAVIKLAAQQQVPILFFNRFGTLQARMWSPYFINIADLRKKQMIFSESVLATRWVIDLMTKKGYEQILNIKRLTNRRPALKNKGEEFTGHINDLIGQIEIVKDAHIDEVRGRLMGFEGNISKQYFQALNLFLPDVFKFERRSRRPATDYFNAALNYLYGMTYSVVESGVFAKGLDPFIGCLHTDFYSRKALVFDLIEPFRPLIDSILFDLIFEKQLEEAHFIRKDQGYWVSKVGKRIIIPSFNDYLNKRINYQGKVRRLKDHIYEESNDLGNWIDLSINQEDVSDHL